MTVTGGAGGGTTSGTAAAGGAATAKTDLALTRVGSTISATSTVTAGRGTEADANAELTASAVGQAYASVLATGGGTGDALATSEAKATQGHATSIAEASGVDTALVRSTAKATGLTGSVTAKGTAVSGTSSIASSAAADVSDAKRSSAETEATFNTSQPLKLVDLPTTSLNAFAYTNGAPSAGTVNDLFANGAHQKVGAKLGSSYGVLGLGSIGAKYGGSGSHTYTANVSYSFNLTSTKNIILGLLDINNIDGFGSLKFDVIGDQNQPWVFTSLASAQTFFNDNPVDLGTFGAGTTKLTLSYSLTAGSAQAAQISYLLATKDPVALSRARGRVRFGDIDRREGGNVAVARGTANHTPVATVASTLRPTMVGSTLTITSPVAAGPAGRRSIGGGTIVTTPGRSNNRGVER